MSTSSSLPSLSDDPTLVSLTSKDPDWFHLSDGTIISRVSFCIPENFDVFHQVVWLRPRILIKTNKHSQLVRIFQQAQTKLDAVFLEELDDASDLTGGDGEGATTKTLETIQSLAAQFGQIPDNLVEFTTARYWLKRAEKCECAKELQRAWNLAKHKTIKRECLLYAQWVTRLAVAKKFPYSFAESCNWVIKSLPCSSSSDETFKETRNVLVDALTLAIHDAKQGQQQVFCHVLSKDFQSIIQ